jgi:phosphoglycolate phosphatase
MKEEASAGRTGVIFDLDGTLVDTLDDLRDCLNECLAGARMGPLSREQLRAMIGDGIGNLIRRASGVDDPARLTELRTNFEAGYRIRLLDQTRLYPGIDRMLNEVAQAQLPMCVLSNKSHEFTLAICAALLSRWPFARFQGLTDALQRKPDPTVAVELARTMGCHPGHVFLVGDAPTDMQTAARAGMKSIAVAWGYRDREELGKANPSHLAEHPEDVASTLVRHRFKQTSMNQ